MLASLRTAAPPLPLPFAVLLHHLVTIIAAILKPAMVVPALELATHATVMTAWIEVVGAAGLLADTAIKLHFGYKISAETLAKMDRQAGIEALAKCEEFKALGMATTGSAAAGPSTSAAATAPAPALTPAKRNRNVLLGSDSGDEALEDADA